MPQPKGGLARSASSFAVDPKNISRSTFPLIFFIFFFWAVVCFQRTQLLTQSIPLFLDSSMSSKNRKHSACDDFIGVNCSTEDDSLKKNGGRVSIQTMRARELYAPLIR